MLFDYWDNNFYMLDFWVGVDMLKKRRKSFKNNDEYFDWFNKNKNEIEIMELKIIEDKIKIIFRERMNEND